MKNISAFFSIILLSFLLSSCAKEESSNNLVIKTGTSQNFPPDACCANVFIQASWTIDTANPGCCLYTISFVNNSSCSMPIYRNGALIATVGPLQVFPVTFSKCENTPPITFTMGGPKVPCKSFTTPNLGKNCVDS